jgi:RNHCP domain
MVFIARQEEFQCEHCFRTVTPLKKSYRNHCPFCLYSKHIDLHGPGDRQNTCLGLLKPIELDSSSKKGYIVIHECIKCSKKVRNKCAPDDEIYNFSQKPL